MDLSNPLYKNQAIHTDVTIFSVIDSKIKVLLVKRGNEPFSGGWMLPGGAVYNNESLDDAAKRELKEKTNIENVFMRQFYAFGELDRDPRMRTVSIAYIAVIDADKVSILQKTRKTLDAQWFDINEVPELLFDHNRMLSKGLEYLKEKIDSTDILSNILTEKFTISDLHNVHEIILGEELDRRNFMRKMVNSGLIEKTEEQVRGKQRRPAYYYKFKK
ncbi:MAG: NUDIX hydrolase [Clostridia bacterium]|jgi:8-oxo-dGTP diphosphatase|nr:NUDIX hydrolase [Clostridia bacterium]